MEGRGGMGGREGKEEEIRKTRERSVYEESCEEKLLSFIKAVWIVFVSLLK